jgi:hypothetical protein
MTHIHLPELEELKMSIKSNPSLLDYYTKIDGWIGSTESVKYLETLINGRD